MTASEAKRYANSPDPRVAAEARRVLDARAASRSRRRERPARAKGTTKAERRADHRVSTASLRAAVWERCGGRDEVTGDELGTAWEMHHVQNAGERRTRQSPGNVLAVSWETHRRAHRGDLGVLELIARAPTLDDAARHAALRRVAKVHEARASVPVRIEVANG